MEILANIGELILKGIVIVAVWKIFLWLLDEGWLKYLLILAAVVGIFLWKTDRLDLDFLPQKEQESTAAIQETENSEDSLYRSAWNKGVCRTLEEDVHVVVIFLDDADSVWYDYTYNWLLNNKLEPGIELIRQQSEAYGHPLNMNYTVYRDIKTDFSVPQPSATNYEVFHSLPEEVAQAMGFSTAAEMLDYHQDYFGQEQIAYFFCVNKHGRSYALPSHSAGSDEVEYCVFFTLYDSGWATSHAAVPHEILHLFGAEDMYAEDTERVNREKLAYQLCPDDLMLCDEHRTPVVDRYTAYTIGWLDSMPAEYNRDEWWS